MLFISAGADTFVSIQMGELVVTQNYQDVLRLGSNLNDAEWHNFSLAISAHGRVEAFVGKFHESIHVEQFSLFSHVAASLVSVGSI